MNTITNDWLLEASRWLWDYFLLATVLLAVVLVLGKFLAQPARRMAVHWATAAGLVLLALLCAVPGWSIINLLSAPPEPLPSWTANLQPLADPVLQTAIVQPTPLQLEPSTATTTMPTSTTVVEVSTKIATVDYSLLSSYVVVAGSVLFSIWLALGHWQMRRIRSQAKPAPPELTALLPQLTSSGLRTPTLGIVAKLPVAAAVGLLHPMVLLPSSFIELANPEATNPESVQSVLAHELAHIRHRDLWLLALLRGLLLVLWPHPLYWLWRRSVRLDQETLADAAAADVTDRTHYAEQLVAWARIATESRSPRLASSVGLWESPSQLKRRIAILLDEKLTVLRECSRRWRVGSALGMLAIAGGLSLITLSPAEPHKALAESQEVTTKEGPGFAIRHIVPPSDASEESSSTADLKPTTIMKNTTNEAQLRLRKQHYKRLNKTRKPNTIIGICIDEKGQPLADVPIEVYLRQLHRPGSNPTPLLETKSDAKGEFFFENIVDVAKEFPEGLPDEYQIGVPQETDAKILYIQGQVEGRVPGISSNTSVNLVRYGSTFVWVMSPAKELRGRVTDNAGIPVADAKVTVGYYASQGGSHGINSATTNANGKYVIDDLPAEDLFGGNQIFLVRHPNFAVRRARMVKIPSKLDVQLVPGSVIEGTVQFPVGEGNKKSLGGSLVHLQRVISDPTPAEQLDAFSYQTQKATLDEEGQFRFESLPAGKYYLTADVESWVTHGVENVEVAPGETATAPDILLRHGGRVQVQLVDSKTGKPMQFEKSTQGYLNPQLWPLLAGVPNIPENAIYSKEGLVEIQLPAGSYRFSATILNPNEKFDLRSALPEAMANWPLEKVVDGELLKISIPMEVQERETNGATATLSFIAAEPPSDEAVEDEAPEVTDVPTTPPAEESKPEDTLAAKLPTVDGRILDLQGKPIANAEVGLALDVDDGERYVAKFSFEATATTDQNGMFSIPFDPALRESLGTIWAYAPGYLPNRVLDIPIIAAFERENTVIRLRKAEQTQFQLLDDQRQPITGASVKVESVKLPESVAFRIPANWASQFETTTDDRGMATIRSVIPNSISQVRVDSQISGVVLFDQDFFLNTQAASKLPHYKLPIPKGGRISGIITASETAAPRSVQLELWTEVTPAFGPRVGVFGSATAVADNQGHFEVPVLAAGFLGVKPQLDDQQPWRLDVPHRKEVVAGKATQLDLPIVRAVRIQGLVRKQDTGEGYPNFCLGICNRKSGQGVKVKTDVKGQFEAFVLPGPVELEIISAPRDYRAAALIMKFEVPANVHDFELEPIDLVPTKNIAGRLVDKNQQPLAGWNVDGFPEVGELNSFNSFTQKNGHFSGYVPEKVLPKFWKVSFRDWSDKYHFEDRKYEAKIISKDPLLLQVDVDISLTSDVPATPPAEESKSGKKPVSKPKNSSRSDRTYIDDRFIFCPVKTELQRNLLGISRGESEEASLCVLVHSEALKTKSGKIDNKALGYPSITKRLKQYAKENNHLVVFKILGSVNTGEPFDDIKDRMEVLSWTFKGLGQHAGFRHCQAPTTYGTEWKKMVDRAEQASAETWNQDEPSVGNDLIRVYPVRTFLSRCLTAGDCVADVLPVIRHVEGEVLKPEILDSLANFLPKVEIPNRTILLLQLRKTNASEKHVNQFMENISKKKKMARTLGFQNLYLQSSWAE